MELPTYIEMAQLVIDFCQTKYATYLVRRKYLPASSRKIETKPSLTYDHPVAPYKPGESSCITA
jgi:hypothetical protein